LAFFILNKTGEKVTVSKKIKGAMLGLLFLLTIPLAVTSCGSGGDQFAGGGIGGTGIYAGTITALGSATVDEIKFDTSEALITVDGDIVRDHTSLAIGMKVEIIGSKNTALPLTGTASRVDFESEVKGPVDMALTANILGVMGQRVVVDGSTEFDDNGTGLNISDLQVGDNVTVSGFFEDDNEIQATFIRLEDPSLTAFKVKGEVEDLIAETFEINDLVVKFSGLPTFQEGDFVEVKGTVSGGFLVATEIEIETRLPVPIPGYHMEIEGLITLIRSQSDFDVNGQRVLTNAQTSYENGDETTIGLNVKVEVEGTVDSSSILIADEVEFE